MNSPKHPAAAIVAHDAGAANHIISWLKTGHLDPNKCRFCLQGPAAVAYKNTFSKLDNIPLETVFDNASLLISGTGWASSLEYDARRLSLQNNIKTVAVLDHWVNYRERFTRGGVEILPDEIWVVDEYAFKLAQQLLPETKVLLQKNDFITLQQKEIKKFDYSESEFTKALFVMEPIRQQWGNTKTPGEIQALEFFITNTKALKLGDKIEIIIKPHPSDPKGKYDTWIQKYRALNIKTDESSSLAQLLAWSDIVIGCQTYAMVVAIAAKKTVVSSLPHNAPKCLLPQKEIIHLSDLVPN